MSKSAMGVMARSRGRHSVPIKPAREEHTRPLLLCAGAVAGAVPEVAVLPRETARVFSLESPREKRLQSLFPQIVSRRSRWRLTLINLQSRAL